MKRPEFGADAGGDDQDGPDGPAEPSGGEHPGAGDLSGGPTADDSLPEALRQERPLGRGEMVEDRGFGADGQHILDTIDRHGREIRRESFPDDRFSVRNFHSEEGSTTLLRRAADGMLASYHHQSADGCTTVQVFDENSTSHVSVSVAGDGCGVQVFAGGTRISHTTELTAAAQPGVRFNDAGQLVEERVDEAGLRGVSVGDAESGRSVFKRGADGGVDIVVYPRGVADYEVLWFSLAADGTVAVHTITGGAETERLTDRPGSLRELE